MVIVVFWIKPKIIKSNEGYILKEISVPADKIVDKKIKGNEIYDYFLINELNRLTQNAKDKVVVIEKRLEKDKSVAEKLEKILKKYKK